MGRARRRSGLLVRDCGRPSRPPPLSAPPPDLPDGESPVGDEVLVYRLVPVWACDAIDGKWEFQSSAFDNATPQDDNESPDDMSVVLGDALAALERVPYDLPDRPPRADEKWGVAVLEVQYLRHQEQQELRRTPDEMEQAHGDVRGKKNGKRRKRLKAHADWIVRPTAPPR